MTLSLSTGTRNAKVNAAVDRLDGGSPGTIKVYTGSKPASPDDAATGTLLITFTLPNPAFGDAASGVATLNAVSSVSAGASGTAGWFRAANSTGAGQFDGTVSTSGADLNLNTTVITSGTSVSVTSGTYTQPGS